METILLDWKLILGYAISHLLLYFTFDNPKVFWYILTGSTLFLISYAVINEDLDDTLPVIRYLPIGIVSGILLYLLIWAGYEALQRLGIHFLSVGVLHLYEGYAPKILWHYILLVLVIVPGEEIFWRGFILKRISSQTDASLSLVLASLLYAFAYAWSGVFVLVLAAAICGLFWGYLYFRWRSLPLSVISHLTFDILLFVFFL
jgi:CAAX amino terminal protease family.